MNKKPNIKLLNRNKNSHKGQFGKCLIIAGSSGMLGAACLTASAALRAGAGVVTLALPKSLQNAASVKLTCVMTIGLEETEQQTISSAAIDEIKKHLDEFDFIAIGPGMSQNAETQEFIRFVIVYAKKPIIIDADGLNALKGDFDLLARRPYPTIITPHPGEFARMLNVSVDNLLENSKAITQELAKKYNIIILLKTAPTIVSDGNMLYEIHTGNPGMSTAGAGDVLTGVIAGLLGQSITPLEASILGAYIHGLAGDIANNYKGEISLIASDILDSIPRAFQNYQQI